MILILRVLSSLSLCLCHQSLSASLFLILFFNYLEVKAHYISQAALAFMFLLLQIPEFQDYRCASPNLILFLMQKISAGKLVLLEMVGIDLIHFYVLQSHFPCPICFCIFTLCSINLYVFVSFLDSLLLLISSLILLCSISQCFYCCNKIPLPRAIERGKGFFYPIVPYHSPSSEEVGA